MESTIDYFYISQSDDSVAEQRRDFLSFVNTVDKEDHKKKEKAFRKKYKGTERGDYWSGKSRKEKIEQGMHKYPPIGKNTPFANVVNSIFDYLNEQVHGNTEVPTLI